MKQKNHLALRADDIHDLSRAELLARHQEALRQLQELQAAHSAMRAERDRLEMLQGSLQELHSALLFSGLPGSQPLVPNQWPAPVSNVAHIMDASSARLRMTVGALNEIRQRISMFNDTPPTSPARQIKDAVEDVLASAARLSH